MSICCQRQMNQLQISVQFVLLQTKVAFEFPARGGGGTPWNFWWGCAARISKSRPNFRPKNAISHTRFQTWPQKSIPVFRPDLARD